MPDAETDALLREISPESPAGPDLSYDKDRLELDHAAKGTPERQTGNAINPAQDPDWADVAERSRALLMRSKDLGVVVQLLRAELMTKGLPGFRDGLATLRGLIEKYWPTMHPMLDPEEQNDPSQRINLIAAISPPADAFSDTLGIRQKLRDAKLCRSPRSGRFGLRDIAVATGQVPPADPNAPKLDISQIDAAFEDTSTEELTETLGAIDGSLAEIERLKSALGEQIGSHMVPDFKVVLTTLKEARLPVSQFLQKRGAAVESAADAAVAPGASNDGSAGQSNGEIRSTRDVIDALERICVFYERYEPSSPIPLIIRRAQRLVSKSFIDIIKDLSPNAIDQIQMISGVEVPR